MEEPGTGEAGRLRTGTRKENISVLQYISSALYWQSLTWCLLAKEKYLKSLHLSRAGGQIWSWEVFDKLINGTVGSSDDTCLSFCLKISPSFMGIFAMCIIYIFLTTWSYPSIVFWFSLSHLSFWLFFICLFFFRVILEVLCWPVAFCRFMAICLGVAFVLIILLYLITESED